MSIYDPVSYDAISDALNLSYIEVVCDSNNYIPSDGIWSNDMRKKAREITLEQFNNPEMRQRHLESCVSHSDKIWINNGKTNKRILKENLHRYPDYIEGRLIPKSCNFGNYDKTSTNNPFYGKSHSDETKKKISNSKKGTKPYNYGKRLKWITDNMNEKQINYNESIPDGWHRGRLKRGSK